MRKLRLSKAKVTMTKPEYKQLRADMVQQSAEAVSKLSQKYGIKKDWL